MTPSPPGVPSPAGPGLRRTTDALAPKATEENRTARRLPASRVPSITGVRLSPHGAETTLINISAHGLLVESDRRLKPQSDVKVLFDGTFEPSSVPSRIVRCAVAGIGQDGTLRYNVGIAFTGPIELDEASAPVARRPEAPRPGPAPAPPSTVLRNRW